LPLGATLLALLLTWLQGVPAVWWWVATLAVMGMRAGHLQYLERRIAVDAGSTRRHTRIAAALAGVSGLSWGMAGYLFMPGGDLASVTLVAVALGAVLWSGALTLATHPPALLAHSLGVLGPPLLSVLAVETGAGAQYLAAGACALAALAIFTALRLHREVEAGIRLRRQKAQLVHRAEQRCASAESATLEAGRFLAAASHDLRQPLYSLHLFVDMLETAPGEQMRQHLVRRIQDALKVTDSLVNGLLDVSRIEAGAVRPGFEPLPLGPLFQRLEAAFGPVAELRGLRLRVRPTSATVFTDPALLESILQNLVGNAIQYTDSGTVLVAARWRAGRVRIEVRDSGPGIAECDQAIVFDEFMRGWEGMAANDASDAPRGCGLGLSIVRRLVDVLGYRLEFRSASGRGTAFAFEMQRCRVTTSRESRTSTRALPRVLLIDGNRNTRTVLEAALSRRDYDTLAVDSLGRARAALQAEPEPDLLLVDCSGWSVAGAIEQLKDLRADIGITELLAYLITADTSTEAARQAAREGVRLLQKPISPERIANTIRHARPQARRPGPRPSSDPEERCTA
jgi:signal transduction histidine kinase/ActR/RegA family two-component response regulator